MAISADVMRSVTELGIASIQENPSAILVKVALKLNETYQYQETDIAVNPVPQIASLVHREKRILRCRFFPFLARWMQAVE